MPENPYFDPDWEQKYLELAARAARYHTVCEVIAAEAGFGSPRHGAALAQWQAVRDAARAARRGQFPTLAAYAAWRFAPLELPYTPDYEAFSSIEQVHAALEHAEAARGDSAYIDDASLPAGQPAGLAAFAPGGAIMSSPRRFQSAELGAPGEVFLDCIVTVHQLGAEIHFCIAHRWGDLSPSSRDQFRNIATVLARQAIEFSLPEAAGLFGAKHATPDKRELIREINTRVSNFRFYRHVLPRRDLKEQFSRVDMTWTGTRYIDPDFEAALYNALPEALRKAQEASGSFFEPALGGPIQTPRLAAASSERQEPKKLL
jgi:HEPN domain-containing protein